MTTLLALSLHFGSVPARAITRRTFLAGAVLSTVVRNPSVSVQNSGGPRLVDLIDLNPYNLQTAAIRAVAERSVIDMARPDVGLMMREARILNSQPTHAHSFRSAFPNLTSVEVDQLTAQYLLKVEVDHLKLMKLIDQSKRSARPREDLGADAREPVACDARLRVPDVLRDWFLGSNLGRPLSAVRASALTSAADVLASESI